MAQDIDQDLVGKARALCARGLTRRQVAKELDIPWIALWKLIQDHDITGWILTSRQKVSSVTVESVCALRDAGYGERQIAVRLGVSRSFIQGYKRRHKIAWPKRAARGGLPVPVSQRQKVKSLSSDEKERYRELCRDFGLPSADAFARVERERISGDAA